MIYVEDDLLDPSLIDILDKEESEFTKVDAGDKSFWIKLPSEDFLNLMKSKIENIEQNDIEVVFSFFREAKENQDDDWRIHNDSIINGQQPDRAAVLFISENNYESLNGTAFWKHKIYGDKFPKSTSEEFDKVLLKDSNNLDLWNLHSVIGHKQNRLVSYPCDYFHSKYPNEFKVSRKVFVIFYKIKK